MPPAHVHDSMSEEHRHQHYARGVVEEATHWSDPSDINSDLIRTPSSLSSSEKSDMVNEMSKPDHATLFFVKRDILLLGKRSGFERDCVVS